MYQGEYAPIAFDGMALAYEYPVYTGRAVSAMPRNSDLAHAHGRLIELGLVSGSPMGAGDFSAQFLNERRPAMIFGCGGVVFDRRKTADQSCGACAYQTPRCLINGQS